MEAIHKAEIHEKEKEKGQRDSIGENPAPLRVDRSRHPSQLGRTVSQSTEEAEAERVEREEKLRKEETPKHGQQQRHHHHHQHHHHHHGHKPKRTPSDLAEKVADCKAKAFAFFGQVCPLRNMLKIDYADDPFL